jgi:adenosylmethionine-8-amino-7-oxononanoate aminotransferase
MHRQIDQLAYAHTSFFTSDVVEQLAEHLTRTAPGELNYAYFVSGGSEAVETALKMARQYFVEIGQPSRTRLSPVNRATTAIRWARWPWAVTNGAVASSPLLMDVIRVSACNEYRDRAAGESQQQYTERLLNELEQAI